MQLNMPFTHPRTILLYHIIILPNSHSLIIKDRLELMRSIDNMLIDLVIYNQSQLAPNLSSSPKHPPTKAKEKRIKPTTIRRTPPIRTA